MYVRRAFQQVQTGKKKICLDHWRLSRLHACERRLCSVCAPQVRKQRALAEELFYQMKSLDLDVANLERLVAGTHSHVGEQEIQKYRARRNDLEKTYDQYLANLACLQREDERTAPPDSACGTHFRRVRARHAARLSGRGKQVHRPVASSSRLAKAIQTAKQNGYTSTISKEMLAQGLPPQFFYLALQESDFDAYSSGPVTRSGVAKGMWQFVPQTAVKYGLHWDRWWIYGGRIRETTVTTSIARRAPLLAT